MSVLLARFAMVELALALWIRSRSALVLKILVYAMHSKYAWMGIVAMAVRMGILASSSTPEFRFARIRFA